MPFAIFNAAFKSMDHTLTCIGVHFNWYLCARFSYTLAELLNRSWPLPVYDILQVAQKEEVTRS